MLTITRLPSRADRLRSYNVNIDGTTIGSIGPEETKSFKLEPGTHTLCVRIDWGRSNKVEFTMQGDEEIQFECQSSLIGSRAWLAIFYALFLPHKYVRLWQVNSKKIDETAR